MSYIKVEYEKNGDPLEVLHVVEVKGIPVPKNEKDVVIQLIASTIHLVSTYIIRGGPAFPQPPLPATPGIEGVGIVHAIGSGVTKFKVGQRVLYRAAWAEYQVVSEEDIKDVVVPNISDTKLAQIVANPATSYGLILGESKFEKGEWALSTAAGSTVGRNIIKFAQMHSEDIPLINVVRRKEQVEELKRETGAEHVLQYDGGDSTELLAKIKEITGGKMIKAAFDPVGGNIFDVVQSTLAPNGEYLLYGGLGGLSMDKLQGNPRARFFRSEQSREKTYYKDVVPQLVKWAAEGKLDLPTEKVYELKDFKEALIHAMKAGGHHGKVLIGKPSLLREV